MKTTRILILLVLVFFYFGAKAQNSNCYQELYDETGLAFSIQLEDLENAACSLRYSLPEEFRDQFKVFDIGLYSLNENMDGGFQQFFNQKILEVYSLSKYYLLFGRQLPDSIGNAKLWIALKLPAPTISECNNKETQIISIIDDLFNPVKNPDDFKQNEIEVMNLIKTLKNCEDCENEIDDDGDGFVDCEDLDCILQSISNNTSGLINNRSTVCDDLNSEETDCLLQNSEFLYLNNINDTESAIEYCSHLTELANLPEVSSGTDPQTLFLIIDGVKNFTCWQASFRGEFKFMSKAECQLFCDYLNNYLYNLDLTEVPYEELYKLAYWCQEIKEKIKLKSLLVYRQSLLFLLEWAVWDLGIESGVRLFSAISTTGRTFGEYKMLESLKNPISSFASLKYAQKFGIQPYEGLVQIFKDLKWTRTGKGVEFHHLIEVRFANVKGVAEWLGSKTNKWKCIVVEANQAEHYPFFTKAWRQKIGYNIDKVPITTANATLQDIKNAAREIYKNYPEILIALGL